MSQNDFQYPILIKMQTVRCDLRKQMRRISGGEAHQRTRLCLLCVTKREMIYSCRVIALLSVNIVPSWDIEGRELWYRWILSRLDIEGRELRRYPNVGQYSSISVQ